MTLPLLVSVTLLAAAVAAQPSPIGFANQEGDASETRLFAGSGHRYQQVHGDMRIAPLPTVTALAFRRDMQVGPVTSPSRSVTLDLWLGQADFQAVTGTFANNYVWPPTRVVTGRTFATPDYSTPRPDRPAPADFLLPLDASYRHAGLDVCWEVQVQVTSHVEALPLDAATGTGGGRQEGTYVSIGRGCQTVAGVLTLQNGDRYFTEAPVTSIDWITSQAPNAAPVALWLGTAGAALPVPGLCGDGLLHVAPVWTIAGVTTNGGFVTPSFTTNDHRALAGVELFAQAVVLDASQPGLPVAVSNGLRSRIALPRASADVTRVYAPGASTPTGFVERNRGLVTVFR